MSAIREQIFIDIDRAQVLYEIGYDDVSKTPARMLSLVDSLLEKAERLVDPSYSYIIKDIDFVQGSDVFLEGATLFQSKVVARLMEHCEQVALFCLTIGNRLEETASSMATDGLVVQSRVLDAIGSNAAEKLADIMQDHLGVLAEIRGLHSSRRFSPGYCDWQIEQQETLFSALNGNSAGIRLTDGYLMVPQKSISGIIGMGTSDSRVRDYNPCRTCHKFECHGRRA